jgi:sporulation protein YlmC with PRC-barrel domain
LECPQRSAPAQCGVGIINDMEPSAERTPLTFFERRLPRLPDVGEPTARELVHAGYINFQGETTMKKAIAGGLMVLALGTAAAYAANTEKAAPAESWTVTNYYKQAVYDPKESKIGDIDDVLVDKSGKITGLIVGVGGFLGVGEKDVIVPFTAVKMSKKNDKWWLTLDETKDSLKSAAGFKYDKASTTWVPDTKSN